MAISKIQPMRPAEIDLIDLTNALELRVTANKEDITGIQHVLDSIQHVLDGIPVFDYGSVEITVESQTTQTGHATFTHAKTNVPYFVATLVTDETTWADSETALEIFNVTEQEFGYVIANQASTPIDFIINWIAIGA